MNVLTVRKVQNFGTWCCHIVPRFWLTFSVTIYFFNLSNCLSNCLVDLECIYCLHLFGNAWLFFTEREYAVYSCNYFTKRHRVAYEWLGLGSWNEWWTSLISNPYLSYIYLFLLQFPCINDIVLYSSSWRLCRHVNHATHMVMFFPHLICQCIVERCYCPGFLLVISRVQTRQPAQTVFQKRDYKSKVRSTTLCKY